MTGNRFPALVGTLSVTVFVTVIAGVVLWIVVFIIVSKLEQLLEFLGLLGLSWQSSHQSLIGTITGAVWTPIIVVLAVRVFRHASAAENAFDKNGKD